MVSYLNRIRCFFLLFEFNEFNNFFKDIAIWSGDMIS